MNMGKMGQYLFIAGAVIAVLTGIIGDMGFAHWGTVLAVAGAVVGFLNVSGAETRTFLIAGIAFLVTAGALNGLPHVGAMISSISSNLTTFAAPAVLIVALKSLMTTVGD